MNHRGSLGPLLRVVECIAAAIMMSACSPSPTTGPESVFTQPPLAPPTQTAAPAEMPTVAVAPVQGGLLVLLPPVSFEIPTGLGTGASGEVKPEVAPCNGCDGAPAHLVLTIQGYSLPGNIQRDAQIHVYPADAYATVNPQAATSMQRLHQILLAGMVPSQAAALPTVPFMHAGQVFASQGKILKFIGGSGVRFITQYASDVSPINNGGLLYHFEGVTDDGMYYVIGILPTSLPFLAADNDPASNVPTGGVAFPQNGAAGSSYDAYFKQVSGLINGSSANQFSPSLDALDALIQSISTQ